MSEMVYGYQAAYERLKEDFSAFSKVAQKFSKEHKIEKEWNEYPLMTYMHEEIVIAIEFKFRQYIRTEEDIEKDIDRLYTLTENQKNIKRFYYASIGFLDLEKLDSIVSKKPTHFQNLFKLALGMPKIKNDTDINYSKRDNWDFYIR